MRVSPVVSITIGTLILSLLVAGIACSDSESSSRDGGGKATSYGKAPGFALPNLEGEIVNSGRFAGKVMLVDFWATWCPPCRRSIPHLKELYAKYHDQGLEVIGIALDRGGREKVVRFAAEMEIQYPVLLGDMNAAAQWQIGSGIPVAYIVDRQGNIVDRVVGYVDKSVLEEKIVNYL